MSSQITVEGILVPADWEASGEVKELALNTNDEREYRLNGLWCRSSRLPALLGKKLRVTGWLRDPEVLQVTRYQVVGSGGSRPPVSEESKETVK